MQWIKLALAGLSITGLGACGTLDRLRPDPVTIVQPLLIPAPCRVEPAERREVPEPALLPETGAVEEVARNRLANARLAFLYWQERAVVAEEQADINADPQRACAAWARAQGPVS